MPPDDVGRSQVMATPHALRPGLSGHTKSQGFLQCKTAEERVVGEPGRAHRGEGDAWIDLMYNVGKGMYDDNMIII